MLSIPPSDPYKTPLYTPGYNSFKEVLLWLNVLLACQGKSPRVRLVGAVIGGSNLQVFALQYNMIEYSVIDCIVQYSIVQYILVFYYMGWYSIVHYSTPLYIYTMFYDIIMVQFRT